MPIPFGMAPDRTLKPSNLSNFGACYTLIKYSAHLHRFRGCARRRACPTPPPGELRNPESTPANCTLSAAGTRKPLRSGKLASRGEAQGPMEAPSVGQRRRHRRHPRLPFHDPKAFQACEMEGATALDTFRQVPASPVLDTPYAPGGSPSWATHQPLPQADAVAAPQRAFRPRY